MVNDYFQAVYAGDISLVKEGIESKKIDPNLMHPQGGHTLLQMACQKNQIPTLKLLLELGADPNYKFTRTDVGGRVIEKNSVALSSAKSKEAVFALLDAGADINVIDGFGYTPLVWAAKSRNVEVVQTLLDSGADHSSKLNVNGKAITPLEIIEGEISSYQQIVGVEPNEKQQLFLNQFEKIKNLLRT